MNTGTYPLTRMPLFRKRLSIVRTETAAQPSLAVSVRAVGNVLMWSSYLPEDCVKTMTRMGWDLTT